MGTGDQNTIGVEAQEAGRSREFVTPKSISADSPLPKSGRAITTPTRLDEYYSRIRPPPVGRALAFGPSLGDRFVESELAIDVTLSNVMV